MQPIIVWFRQDLRLSDNPVLSYAAKQHLPVIPIYIFDTTIPKSQRIGSAARWWLHHSLLSLQKQLLKQKLKLIFRKGDPKKILLQLAKKTRAQGIFWNRCYEPYVKIRDKKLQTLLIKNNFQIKIFNGSLLFSPDKIFNRQHKPFKIFSAYWKYCLKQADFSSPLPVPKLKKTSIKIKSDSLQSWNLLPKIDWANGIRKTWQPGEPAAQKKLRQFIRKKLINYAKYRDRPDIDGTSLLSPYLHFGEISPRQIWFAVNEKSPNKKFLMELGWREFAYYTLFYFPQLPTKPLRSQFNKIPWNKNARLLKAWQQGKTGYPIVDAGMRQLWQTGWLHNRVRMIVASFLVKDLLISWQTGAAWFLDTLVDADLANNSLNWQWVAGCGIDASPFFRVFNPITQRKKFDPQEKYINRWILELKTNYPHPIVNHEFARKKALAAYKKIL